MKTPLLICCVSVVVVIGYLAVFFIIQHSREMSAPPREVEAPKDTRFKTTTIHYQDNQGHEVQRERRFEVNTELVSPEVMKQLPPPPGATAAPIDVPAATGAKAASNQPAVGAR